MEGGQIWLNTNNLLAISKSNQKHIDAFENEETDSTDTYDTLDHNNDSNAFDTELKNEIQKLIVKRVNAYSEVSQSI